MDSEHFSYLLCATSLTFPNNVCTVWSLYWYFWDSSEYTCSSEFWPNVSFGKPTPRVEWENRKNITPGTITTTAMQKPIVMQNAIWHLLKLSPLRFCPGKCFVQMSCPRKLCNCSKSFDKKGKHLRVLFKRLRANRVYKLWYLLRVFCIKQPFVLH